MNLKLVKVTQDSPYLPQIYAINDEAFPEEERIPSDMMFQIMERYGCILSAVVNENEEQNDELIGFIAMVPDYKIRIGYMWFFAIRADLRDRGYGGAALRLFQESFPELQLVLDMEVVEPTAQNYEQRLRRLKFYERNGFTRAMVGMSYHGLDFEIMSTKPPFRYVDFQSYLNRVSSAQWQPRIYPLELKSQATISS